MRSHRLLFTCLVLWLLIMLAVVGIAIWALTQHHGLCGPKWFPGNCTD